MKNQTAVKQSVKHIYERACKIGLVSALLELEKQVVRHSIKVHKKTSLAGKSIGVKRTTMYEKRNRYGF